jgi:acyl-coenzyme A thioesterase PaaI-like protein
MSQQQTNDKTPPPSNERLKRLRSQTHTHCLICASDNPHGLNLDFAIDANGKVSAECLPGDIWQGYNGLVHGGVIASMLDAAMTNCLFAHGCEALTAELVVRYRHPVVIGEKVVLRAWMEERTPHILLMRAELSQGDTIKSLAKAKFLPRPAHEATDH